MTNTVLFPCLAIQFSWIVTFSYFRFSSFMRIISIHLNLNKIYRVDFEKLGILWKYNKIEIFFGFIINFWTQMFGEITFVHIFRSYMLWKFNQKSSTKNFEKIVILIIYLYEALSKYEKNYLKKIITNLWLHVKFDKN